MTGFSITVNGNEIQVPCSHNSWDNVRVLRKVVTLRCRSCHEQWRSLVGEVWRNKSLRCMKFGTRKGCDGDCGRFHFHARKLRKDEKEEEATSVTNNELDCSNFSLNSSSTISFQSVNLSGGSIDIRGSLISGLPFTNGTLYHCNLMGANVVVDANPFNDVFIISVGGEHEGDVSGCRLMTNGVEQELNVAKLSESVTTDRRFIAAVAIPKIVEGASDCTSEGITDECDSVDYIPSRGRSKSTLTPPPTEYSRRSLSCPPAFSF